MSPETAEKLLIRFGKAYSNLAYLEGKLKWDSMCISDDELKKARHRVAELKELLLSKMGTS